MKCTVDVALLGVGVGELTLAIRGLRAAYASAAAAPRSVAAMRFILAAADVSVAYGDIICQDSDSEICQKWQQVSFYASIGLLVGSGIDIATDLRRIEELAEASHGIYSTYKHIGKLDPAVLNKIDNWQDPKLFDNLDEALDRYPSLDLELAADLNLVDHFEGINTDSKWYYKIGLSRAVNYKTPPSQVVDFSSKPRFKQYLDEILLDDGRLLGDLDAQALGNLLEYRLNDILINNFNNGNFENIDLPAPLKRNLQDLYDDDYVLVAQAKLKINERTPEPDFLFFKRDAFGYDLTEPVKYYDAKLHISTGFGSAQDELIQYFDDVYDGSVIVTVENIPSSVQGITQNLPFQSRLLLNEEIKLDYIGKIATKLIQENQIKKIDLVRFTKKSK